MAGEDTAPVVENRLICSIQCTYILTVASTSGKEIMTCNQQIDIPTIEQLRDMKAVVYPDEFSEIVPCIELVGKFLNEYSLAFETNEGVTVLPIKIAPGSINSPNDSLENPYMHTRYLLVLPRGATGVKSCKIIHKATGKEVQHNFTFGIMPPPYNYDNALLGYLSGQSVAITQFILAMNEEVTNLKARVTALENKAGG